MLIDAEITQNIVKYLFNYKDGNLYWNHATSRRNPDKPVGYLANQRYIKVRIYTKSVRVHRLIWIWHNGAIPQDLFIDHIDTNKVNNKIENLRLATQQQNNCNVGKRKDNTTGLKGVSLEKGKKGWRAQIHVNKKRIHIGYFKTPELASSAYNEAVSIYHTSFANVG